MKSLGFASLLLLLSACSTTRNPLYCDQEQACADPSMYCDVTGDMSGTPNTCIEKPVGRTCEMSSECTDEPTQPICDLAKGKCRECASGDECEQAGLPGVCTLEGECVECESDDDCGDQLCNEDLGVCEPCTEHSQCASGVCDAAGGQCVDAAQIIYVDQNDAAADDFGPCDAAKPCATIGGAVQRIAQALDERVTIFVRGDAGVIYEEVLVFDGLTATIIAPGLTLRPDATDGDKPVIDIANEADITLQGLRITGATGNVEGDGIRCTGNASIAALRLLEVDIDNNDGTGVEANRCTLEVERSSLSDNRRGGISLTGSDFTITNNFIVDNGDIAASAVGGVVIENFGATTVTQQEFAFNTVFRNRAASAADASGVRCRVEAAMTAQGNIVYGNLGDPPTVDGNCAWAYSNIEGGATGEGNIDQAPAFVDADNSDFHLQPGSPGVDVDGLTSTISVDHDGDVRPQGTAFDMGADEVVP